MAPRSNWLVKRSRSTNSARPRRRATAAPPLEEFRPSLLEMLESRLLLSTVTVTTALDSVDPLDGLISLREAVTEANTDPTVDVDTINFNIPGGGVQTINLTSSLDITEAVTINGYTQPGAAAATASSNAVITVQITRSGGGDSAFDVTGDGSTIRGLAIYSVGGSDAGAIRLFGDGNTVAGNFLGITAAGSSFGGNSSGVRIEGTNNTVGGTTEADRNIISGNSRDGVTITGASATGNTIVGNFIGTTIDGVSDRANGLEGVFVSVASGNTISGNVISGNNRSGVLLNGNGNTVQGNKIGTDKDGNVVAGLDNALGGVEIAVSSGNMIGGAGAGEGNLIAGNSQEGVDINNANDNFVEGNTIASNATNGVTIRDFATGNMIGGLAAGAGNTITANGGDGVAVGIELLLVESNVDNSILSNSITANGDLAIDLHGPGVTANDLGDADVGANDIQNFPVITSAFSGGVSTTIDGTLNSVASGDYLIEFFANSAADSSGHGEGETLIGSTTVTTDGSGDASFSVNVAVGLTGSDFVTATATELAGATPRSTSEFSAAVAVTVNTAPTADAGGPYAVDEDGTVGLDGSNSTDLEQPDASLTYAWDLDGDLVFGETGAAAERGDEVGITPTFDAAGLDGPDSATVQLRVTDDGGLTDTASATVTVNNVAPSAVTLDPVAAIDENGTANLSGTFVDPGGADVHTVTVDWGDGVVDNITLTTGARTFNASHQYLDDDPTGTASDDIDITVSVADDDLGVSVDAVATVTVNNVAPTVTSVTGPAVAAPGEEVTFVGAFTDPGTLDTHTLDWEVRDAANTVVATGSGGSIVFTPPGSGDFTVTYTVTDDDTGSDSDTANLTVAVAAVITDPLTGQQTLVVGGDATAEHIIVRPNGSGGVQVRIGGTVVGDFNETVERIVVNGGDGNDRIRISRGLGAVDVELNGGEGNDLLAGGLGEDILIGGPGNDLMLGRGGRDFMIGGLGEDRVIGQGDDDVLVGGVYVEQDNRVALLAILDEWTRTDLGYLDRVDNLQNGTGLNGPFELNDTTVLDDGVRDRVLGLRGLDYFLVNDAQDRTDERANEVLTDTETAFVEEE